MLIDLTAEFFTAAAAPDPLDAYRRYYDEHRPVLAAYWRNHILDPEGPQADDVILRALRAQRRDLHALLDHVDVRRQAQETIDRCQDVFAMDRPVDVYLMVGVGGPNAGELVVGGRGIAFVCLEHFTGRPNAETFGLGLKPDLIPLWIAHEMAHTVRYTSPQSRSELARLIYEARGNYDYWDTGSQTTLVELLVNEGLAVAASREVAPGFEAREYFGYGSHQYRRLRELEAFLRHAVADEMHRRGLGYRLRYLSGGVSQTNRVVGGKVLPERAGYYLGYRMVETFVAEHGIAASLRASAREITEADQPADEGAQTA
jgi:Predicted Zn-dependent protease (DUF2268)